MSVAEDVGNIISGRVALWSWIPAWFLGDKRTTGRIILAVALPLPTPPLLLLQTLLSTFVTTT